MFVNNYLQQKILSSSNSHFFCSIETESGDPKSEFSETHRTELDSHANMPVIGRNARVISTSDKTCDVKAFSPEIRPLKVKMVDAAVEYICPYSGQSYILVIRNGLYVPSMAHNLIPPFIMREVGIRVNDTAKIHLSNPTEEDHAIIFAEENFRIPLRLNGIFSFFETEKPSVASLNDGENVFVLTPEKWNPFNGAFASSEDSMLDQMGNMVLPKFRQKIV